jgi:hypothetical protein
MIFLSKTSRIEQKVCLIETAVAKIVSLLTAKLKVPSISLIKNTKKEKL